MLEQQKPHFDPDRTARSLYILIIASFVIDFVGSSLVLLSSIVSLAFLIGIIYKTMPVRDFIQDVNDTVGNRYSSQTVFYYIIILYSVFFLLYMLLVRAMSMLGSIPTI